MKRCPLCHTPYHPSEFFCTKDGTPLIDEIPAGFDTQPDTLILAGKTPITQPMDADENKFVCPDKWLHEIAEDDKNNIRRMVRVLECQIDLVNFNQDIPTIDFTFRIFNGSVYDISLKDSIEGHIKFYSQELYMPIKMKDNSAINIPRGEMASLTILQVLSREDVANISPKHDDSPFWFRDLILTIEGGEKAINEVKPQRLRLNGGITKGGRSFL